MRASKATMSFALNASFTSSFNLFIADGLLPCTFLCFVTSSSSKPRLFSQLFKQAKIVFDGSGKSRNEVCRSMTSRTSCRSAPRSSSSSMSRSSSFEAPLTSRTKVLTVLTVCSSCRVSETTAMMLAAPSMFAAERSSPVSYDWARTKR